MVDIPRTDAADGAAVAPGVRAMPVAPAQPASAGPICFPSSETLRHSAERAAALRDLLSKRAGERHVVAIQDFPDPDAISSALGYKLIANGFGIEVDVAHEGTISHPENLALVNLLELEIVSYTPTVSLETYDAAVYIDNQGTTTRLSARLRDARVPTLAVIDHHDPQDVLDPLFSDVRPVGAAATIVTEYLQSGIFFELDGGNATHVQLATALMHGLHSETESFVRAGREELAAAAYLATWSDVALLERVLCVQKSRGTMDTIQAALAHRIFRGGFSVAGVGHVRWDDRDAIPQAADFMLTEQNVHTAVVYGLVRDETGREIVSGSLRTNNATLGVDAFLKRALGRDVRGQYYGGGRTRAGGFEIDVGFLAGDDGVDYGEQKWALFDRQIRRRLFKAAGVAKERKPQQGTSRPQP